MNTLLEQSVAQPIEYRFLLKKLRASNRLLIRLEYEGTKIRPNLRIQTISKIEGIKIDFNTSCYPNLIFPTEKNQK
jgi:hypothetical protein